jgi:hypothetical protein
MAKRNVDRMFEKFSPVSGGRATDRASVSERPGNASPMDAVDGTVSGNTNTGRGAVFNSVDDAVTER